MDAPFPHSTLDAHVVASYRAKVAAVVENSCRVEELLARLQALGALSGHIRAETVKTAETAEARPPTDLIAGVLARMRKNDFDGDQAARS